MLDVAGKKASDKVSLMLISRQAFAWPVPLAWSLGWDRAWPQNTPSELSGQTGLAVQGAIV